MSQLASGAKIVIVEDDAALADIYKTRLELLGYVCFIARDGIEALTIIEKERPDLVLLDIMLPKVAGDQILKVMRSTAWGKNIKVLVISNLNEADAPAGIRDLGIEGYAVKANLSDDQVDHMVDDILKPAGQKEDINLDSTPPPTIAPVEALPAVATMEPAVPPPAEATPITTSETPPKQQPSQSPAQSLDGHNPAAP